MRQRASAAHGRGHVVRDDDRERVADGGGDPLARLADEHDRARAPAQHRDQRRVVATLVAPTGDEHERAHKALQRADDGADVGGLRVVVEGDAVDLARRLHAVRQRPETFGALADGALRDADGARDQERGQRVLVVVTADQREIGRRVARLADHEICAVEPGVRALVGREAADARARRRLEPALHDRKVALRLVEKDALLGGSVGAHVGVAVEVILGDVEQGGDLRVRVAHGLELEARHLGDDEPVLARGGPVGGLDERRAEVAADEQRAAELGAEVAAERRRGGLAVGAGDRDERAAELPARELVLADDLDACAPRRVDLGERRNAGAEHDQVGRSEALGAVAAELERRGPAQCAHRAMKLGLGAHVGHRDARPAPREEARGREAGPAEADDEDAPAREAHLIFSVASATIASSSERIQARTTIFGSSQPCNS